MNRTNLALDWNAGEVAWWVRDIDSMPARRRIIRRQTKYTFVILVDGVEAIMPFYDLYRTRNHAIEALIGQLDWNAERIQKKAMKLQKILGNCS